MTNLRHIGNEVASGRNCIAAALLAILLCGISWARPPQAIVEPVGILLAQAKLPASSPAFKYIKAAYAYEQYGYITFDANQVMRYDSPDWIFHESTEIYDLGKTGVENDLYQWFKEVVDEHHSVKRTVKIVQFKQSGDSATVLILATMTVYDENDRPTPYPGYNHWCGVTGYYQDEWARSGNEARLPPGTTAAKGWIIRKTTLIDGPVPDWGLPKSTR